MSFRSTNCGSFCILFSWAPPMSNCYVTLQKTFCAEIRLRCVFESLPFRRSYLVTTSWMRFHLPTKLREIAQRRRIFCFFTLIYSFLDVERPQMWDRCRTQAQWAIGNCRMIAWPLLSLSQHCKWKSNFWKRTI
jgi:hypothetical protein